MAIAGTWTASAFWTAPERQALLRIGQAPDAGDDLVRNGASYWVPPTSEIAVVAWLAHRCRRGGWSRLPSVRWLSRVPYHAS